MNTDCDGNYSGDSSACYYRRVYNSSTVLNTCQGTTLNQNATVQGNTLSHQWIGVSICGLVSIKEKLVMFFKMARIL